MYKIIGADQKVYGPITADQMRQWIAQGRVNAQTQVQVDGTNEWKPLSAFPEFASLASTMAPLPAAGFGGGGGGRDAALAAVKGPVIGLKVTAIVGLVVVALGLIVNVLSMLGVNFGMDQFNDPDMPKIFNPAASGALGIFGNLVGIVVAILILKGAAKMAALENHSFAITASILALLPCVSPCCLIGVFTGIWALVVLNKPEVKSQFT